MVILVNVNHLRVTIPVSVTFIKNEAIYFCEFLEKVVFQISMNH